MTGEALVKTRRDNLLRQQFAFLWERRGTRLRKSQSQRKAFYDSVLYQENGVSVLLLLSCLHRPRNSHPDLAAGLDGLQHDATSAEVSHTCRSLSHTVLA